jgi:pyridoxal phosphate enzyme (YggS family)
MLPESVAERYALVQSKIAEAAKRAGRKAGDVILTAVTKYADADQIRTLLQLGHRDFGENRVQVLMQHAAMVEEYLSRQRMLASSRRVEADPAGPGLFVDPRLLDAAPANAVPATGGVRWHMIGHLQRNKARKLIDTVRIIHSVDSLRLAEELQAIAVRRDRVIEVLLQVNCAGETSKFGCPMPAAIPLAEQIATMVNVRLRGLMTMAEHVERAEDARPTFARCRELFEEMAGMGLCDGGRFNILSMGMSGDYEVAIQEGSNIVRVGTAIFGDKEPGATIIEPPEPEEQGEAV